MATAGHRSEISLEAESRYRWMILAVIVVGQILISAVYLAWGSLAPFLRAEFALTREQIGLVVGAGPAGSMIGSTPFGQIGDRIGARRMLVAGIAGMAVAGVFLSLAPSYFLIFLTMLAVGLSFGALNPNGAKVLVPWFPRNELGTAIGLKMAGFPLGGTFAASTLPALALALGTWRLPVAGLGVLVALAAVASYYLIRERPAERPQAVALTGRWWTPILHRDILLLCLMGVIFSGAQGAWNAHFVLFAQEHLGLPITVGAGLLAIGQLSAAAGCFLLGLVSDRLFGGRRRELLIVCGLVTAGLFFVAPLLVGAPIWLLGLVTAAFGLSGSSWAPLRVAALAAAAGERSAGIVIGFGLATGSLGAALSSPLLGRAADTLGVYAPAWQGAAVVVLVGVLLAMAVREPKRSGQNWRES